MRGAPNGGASRPGSRVLPRGWLTDLLPSGDPPPIPEFGGQLFCTSAASGHLTSGQIIGGATLVEVLRQQVADAHLHVPRQYIPLLFQNWELVAQAPEVVLQIPAVVDPTMSGIRFNARMEPIEGIVLPDARVVEHDTLVEQIVFQTKISPASQISIRISNGVTFYKEMYYVNNTDQTVGVTLESEQWPGLDVATLDSCTFDVVVASIRTWSVAEVNEMVISAGIFGKTEARDSNGNLPPFGTGFRDRFRFARLNSLAMTVTYENNETETVRPDRLESHTGTTSGGTAVEVLADDSLDTFINYEEEIVVTDEGERITFGRCNARKVGFHPLLAEETRRIRSLMFDFFAESSPPSNRWLVTSLPNTQGVGQVPVFDDPFSSQIRRDLLRRDVGPVIPGAYPAAQLHGFSMCVRL